jgi:hypothetical protein
MSRVIVPLKNTDMMCMVNKNIYDDGEYEGLAWIKRKRGLFYVSRDSPFKECRYDVHGEEKHI